MPDNKNLLNLDDLADVFAQLNDIEDAPKELTEEEKASRNIRIIINQMNLNDCPKYSKAVVFICVITQIPVHHALISTQIPIR